MKIKYAVPLLLLAVTIFVGVPSVHADILYKNKDQKCFTAVRCDDADANCVNVNSPPKVHRAKLTLEQRPAVSSKVFLYECYHFNETGDPICVPAPINTCTDEGCTLKPQPVGWNSNTAVYRQAFEAICKHSVGPGPQGATQADLDEECKTVVDEQMAAVSEKVNSISLNYEGVYTPSADNSALQELTSLPSSQTLADVYEWGSSNDFIEGRELPRSFIAVTFTDPVQGTQGTTISDKLSMLGFKSTNSCDRVQWDPYGRVFYDDATNSMNLEPVADAWIGVYQAEVDAANNTVFKLMPEMAADGFLNPRKTSTFGDYSFLVGQGTYRLQVKASKAAFTPGEVLAPPDATGQIPGSLISLNASMLGTSATVRVDGKDIVLYPNVYQSRAGIPAPDIVQVQGPERADVGITGITPKPIKLVEVQQLGLPSGNHLLRGTLSKPLGRVVVTLKSTGAKLGEVYANLNGEFSVTIDPVKNGVTPTDKYIVSEFATPLSVVTPAAMKLPFGEKLLDLLSMFVKKVEAAELGGLPVRLNYVKGVAYSKSGTVLKNATITVVDASIGMPVYGAITDETGMFEVPSDKLPAGGYYFLYRASGSSIAEKVTVEEFVQANKVYLESGEVDVFTPKNSAGSVQLSPDAVLTQKAQEKAEFNQGVGGKSAVDNGSNVNPQDPNQMPQDPNKPVVNNQTNTMLLVYVVVLLILVVGVGILVVYYLKRKQDPHLYDQQV